MGKRALQILAEQAYTAVRNATPPVVGTKPPAEASTGRAASDLPLSSTTEAAAFTVNASKASTAAG